MSAYYQHMMSASNAAKDMASNAMGAEVNLNGVTAAANNSRLALIGMQAATMALNMVLVAVVSFAIQKAITGINDYIHAIDRACEKADEARGECESVSSELQSLQSELEKTKERIEELQSQGSLSLVEEAELAKLEAQNRQLEYQYEIQKKLFDLKQKGAAESSATALSKKSFDTGFNIVETAINAQKRLDNLKRSRQDRLKEQTGYDPDSSDFKRIQKDIAIIDDDITYYEQILSENLDKVNTNYASLFDAEGNVLRGYEDIAAQCEELFKSVLSDSEKATKTTAAIENVLSQKSMEGVQNNLVKAARQSDEALTDAIDKTDGLKLALSEADVSTEDFVTHIKHLADEGKESYDKLISFLGKDNIQSDFENFSVSELEDYIKEEKEKAKNLGVDLSKTIFGNIDTDNRQALVWTDENLAKYKEAIESWGDSTDDLKDSFSTVYGMMENFGSDTDPLNISFSPMLQTENGAVFLDANTVYEYIWGLIDKAGEERTPENLLRLDTEGLEFDGRIIKGLLADVGETAESTAESMHFVGDTGSIAEGLRNLEDAKKKAYFDTLSASDLEIAAQLSLETGAADWSLKEWKNRIKNEQQIQTTLKLNIETETENLDSVKDALSESLSATGLTSETKKSIEKIFSGVEGYDQSKLFEKTANGVRLNSKALEELQKKYEETKKNDLSNSLDSLKEKYERATNELYLLTDGTEEYNDKLNEVNGLKTQIQNVELLSAEYDGLTSSYNKFLAALEGGKNRDSYEKLAGSYDDMKELVDQGWYGDESLNKYLDLMLGDNRTDSVIKDFDKLSKKIEDTNFSITDFFKFDKDDKLVTDGLFDFLDTVKAKLGEEYVQISKDGYSFDFSGDKLKEVADTLGTTTELVQIFEQAMIDAGMAINFDSAVLNIDDLKSGIEETKTSLEKLGVKPVAIDIEQDDVESVKEKIKEIKDNKDLDLNVKTLQLQYANQYLDLIIAKKVEAEQPSFMNFEASEVDKDLQNILTLLQEYQEAVNHVETLKLKGVDSAQIEKAEERADSLLRKIYELNDKDAKVKIGINAEDSIDDLKSKISGNKLEFKAEVKPELNESEELSFKDKVKSWFKRIFGSEDNANKVNVDINISGADALSKINEELLGFNDKTIVASVETNGKDDIDALNGSVNDLKDRTVKEEAKVVGKDKVDDLNDAINRLNDRNVYINTYINNIVNKNSKGANGVGVVDGTAHSFVDGTTGRAFQSGDWGTKDSGVALGGEEDQELVVRNGRFFTIGDDSAEFFKYQKNDIIFNADQTRQILKYGKITHGRKRGRAFAEGTAFDNGSNGNRRPGSSGTYSAGSKPSSSGKTSSSKSSNSSSDKTDEALERFNKYIEKLFDWIEVRLDKLQRKTDKYIDKAEKKLESGNYSGAKKQYQNAMSSISTQISANQKGKDEYQNQANEILKKAISEGIISKDSASKIKKKVANGTIDISQYGERMRTVIQDYQDWYEKSLQCSDNVQDLLDQYTEFAEAIANLPLDKAAAKVDVLGDKLSVLEAKLEVQNTAQGKNTVLNSETKNAKDEYNAYKKASKEANTYVNSLWKSSALKDARKSTANKDKKKGEKLSTAGLDKNSAAYKAVIKYNAALEAQKKATQDAEKASYEYTATLRANTKAKFDNIAAEYESKQSVKEGNLSLTQAKIDSRSSLGYSQTSDAMKGLYNTAISQNKSILSSQEEELKKLQKNYEKNKSKMSAEDRRDAQNQITALKEEIISTKAEIADLQTELNNIEVKKLEISIERLQANADKLQDAISLKEVKGLSATAKDYNDLINNSKSQVTNLENQNAELKKQQKGLSTNSEKYQELQAKIEANEKSIRDAKQNQEEWNNAITELPLQKLEKALELLDSIADYDKSLSDLKTAQGLDLSAEDYTKQIDNNTKKIGEVTKEQTEAYNNYLKALSNTDKAFGGKTADEWLSEYKKFGTEINNLKIANEELKKSLRDDVYWRDFERAHEAAQRLSKTLSGIKDLISEDMYFDSNGNLTDFGILQVANLVSEYENAQREVKHYSNDIKKLNEEYAKGLWTQEAYKEKMAEFQSGLLDSASNMKSAMKEITDMYKNMAQSELDSLYKLIDARNDALSAKKSYYEYDKTIKSKTKDIQALQAQLAALEGIETAEAKAKKAQLSAQLSEAQDDLNDTINEHALELSQNALSDLKDTLQEAFDDRWDDISGNLSKMAELMSASNMLIYSSSETINDTLNDILKFFGIDSSLITSSLAPDISKEDAKDIADALKDAISDMADFLNSVLHRNTEAHYAKGTKSVPRNLTALTNENGKNEIIVTKDGLITPLDKGDGVVPADLTERLYKLAKGDLSIMPQVNIPKFDLPDIDFESHFKPEVTQHYDALINIEGSADAATVEDLKKLSDNLLEKSYKYTSDKIFKGYMHGGGKRRV